MFELPKKFVDEYRQRPVSFGWNGLGEVAFYRTYSRRDNPKARGTMETWADVCERAINGMYSFQGEWSQNTGVNWNQEKAERSAREAFDLMFNFKWSPPGRGLWMANTDFVMKRGTVEACQNCGFISSKFIKEERGGFFSWLMEMSMLGVGVGFDTRGANLLEITKPTGDVYMWAIEDTREGWAQSVEWLINSYVDNGSSPLAFDYSSIRPKGSPIHGFGGVASGPDPLIELHDSICSVLDAKHGQMLDTRTIVDLCNMIGKCVVAGNVRRSAEIAFGAPDDEQFIDLKNYKKHPERMDYGWVSNNSIFAEVGMDYTDAAQRTYENGEPGYFWLGNAQKYGRMDGLIDNADAMALGGNPCVTGDTWIYTANGMQRAVELFDAGNDNDVVIDGRFGTDAIQPASRVFATGIKDVYRLKTVEGYEVRATSNHQIMTADGWRELGTLRPGDKIHILNRKGGFGSNGSLAEGRFLGWLVGDGHISGKRVQLDFYGGKRELAPMFLDHMNECLTEYGTNNGPRDYDISVQSIEERDQDFFHSTRIMERVEHIGLREEKLQVPDIVFAGCEDMQRGYLQALFSADGMCIGSSEKGVSVRLSSVSDELLIDVQRLLLNFGIASRLYRNRQAEGERMMPNGKGGHAFYHCQSVHELVITKSNLVVFKDEIGFLQSGQQEKLELALSGYKSGPYNEYFVSRVESVDYDGTEMVYDLSQPSTNSFIANGIVVHNCLEQILHHKELCTLVEIYLPRCKNKAEFERAIKYAYLYGKSTTLATDKISDLQTREVMQRNRRIGLSVTGITQFLGLHGMETLRDWLDHGHYITGYYDRLYSQWLGVNESIRRNSVKPSGTVSLVAGVTPGVHYNVAGRYHIRRMIIADDSPLIPSLQRAGYPMEESAYTPGSLSVSFPIDAGPGVRSESEVSMRTQLDLIALVQRHWADNAVSATVKFDQRTTSPNDIKAALEEYQYKLKGVSFLPSNDHGYAQAPYESITKEQFAEMSSGIDKLRINTIGDGDKQVDAFCDGDACVVPQVA